MNKAFQHPQVPEEYIPSISTLAEFICERGERRKEKVFPPTSPARSVPAQRILSNKRAAVMWMAEIALIKKSYIFVF